ncbi:ABC transporter substrate-binding protein [Cryptosporangium sp. NPDC048952]|uniref:ABC transporter substrate-binding protein n=1 Tax=Cryptosporangium sp. NPDC048952 TaxID=3363961 RepID=UPI003722AC41
MTFRWLRTGTLVAASTATALLLAACGGGSSSSSSGAPTAGKPVTVTAGFIPVVDVAALYLGVDQGIFKKHGINLTIKTGQGGAALVPPVVTGEYQFAFSNIVSVIQAQAKGLPLKVIGSGSSSTGQAGKDVSMIRVREDSPIKTAADLAGKRVSVNTLGNLLELLGDTAVNKAGGAIDSVNYVEMPFPDAVTALKDGKIDAMVTAEPFDTIAAASTKTRIIASPYLDMSPSSLTTSVYFSSEAQLKKDPKLFEAITAAIDESLTYAQSHPDDVRTQVTEYAKVAPDVAKTITLPTFAPDVPEASVKNFSALAKQFGMTTKDVSYDDLVWSGSGQ